MTKMKTKTVMFNLSQISWFYMQLPEIHVRNPESLVRKLNCPKFFGNNGVAASFELSIILEIELATEDMAASTHPKFDVK